MPTKTLTRPGTTAVYYRDSDGKPMAETPWHRDLLFLLIEMLRWWYTGRDDIYISGNMFLYYEEGNPRRSVSPDVQLTLGIPRLPERRIYCTWVEGKAPDVVFELTSRSTQTEDLDGKYEIYRRIGVREYFMFDPEGDYLSPRLVGYQLVQGEYEIIEPIAGRLPSRVMKLHVETVESQVRLYDPATKRWVPTPEELRDAILRAESAEAEIERLRRELEQVKKTRKRKS